MLPPPTSCWHSCQDHLCDQPNALFMVLLFSILPVELFIISSLLKTPLPLSYFDTNKVPVTLELTKWFCNKTGENPHGQKSLEVGRDGMMLWVWAMDYSPNLKNKFVFPPSVLLLGWCHAPRFLGCCEGWMKGRILWFHFPLQTQHHQSPVGPAFRVFLGFSLSFYISFLSCWIKALFVFHYDYFFIFNGNRYCLLAKSLQSCSTLCNPMDYSPTGSCVHEILQTRILEWFTISFSRQIDITCMFNMNFPGGTSDKEPTCQCRRHKGCVFHPWVRKIP